MVVVWWLCGGGVVFEMVVLDTIVKLILEIVVVCWS